MRLRSFNFAFRGLAILIRDEHNARIHLLAAVTAITAGILLNISSTEWILLSLVIGLVFVAELINSAVEALSDVVRHEFDEGIRKAKDYSAAAVLLSALISVITGAIIFLPRIIRLLSF